MQKFSDDYTCQLEEIHHVHKKDAPSGTAISIAEGIFKHSDYNSWKLDETEGTSLGIEAIREGEVPGFLPGYTQENNGIIRHGAKIVYAFAEATVPKLTVITRKAYGGAYIVMNSKQTGADVNFAYPSAEIAVMGADGAINILFRKADEATKAKELEAYKEKFATPYQAAELGYIDEIIYPRQTRKRLIQALEMTENKMQTNPPKKHGNMPL
jgi:propionyl-CoA carboxylase beta chain